MSKHFLHRIKEEIRKGIPGESSHLKMSPINRISLKNKILLDANVKESAVAVILHINSENMMEFLLIQRSTYDGKHSGQIAFPGGKRDSYEHSPIQTARREFYEETGGILSDDTITLLLENTQLIPFNKYILFVSMIDTDEKKSKTDNI